MGNWERELRIWLPSAKVVKFIATKDIRNDLYKKFIKSRDFQICIINYDGIKICFNWFKKIMFEYVIIDEAHMIKNDSTLVN